MPEMPKVAEGGWIRVGEREALVCRVYDKPVVSGDIEVVYFDNRMRPSYNDVVWSDTQWQFVEAGDYGGYAENVAHLAHWVRILRSGRPR